jgi:predicted ferric reductase
MLTTSKTHQKMWPFVLSVAATLILWLVSKWYFQDWFFDPYKYFAKAASLSATILMCWCICLSTRLPPLEGFFGGLDKVYQIHKRLGKPSFF